MGKAYAPTRNLEVEELIVQSIVERLAKDVTVVSVANAKQKFLDGVKNMGKDPVGAISRAKEVKATHRVPDRSSVYLHRCHVGICKRCCSAVHRGRQRRP